MAHSDAGYVSEAEESELVSVVPMYLSSSLSAPLNYAPSDFA